MRARSTSNKDKALQDVPFHPSPIWHASGVDEDYSESFGEDDHNLFPVSLLKLLTPNQRVVGTTACITGVGVGAQLV